MSIVDMIDTPISEPREASRPAWQTAAVVGGLLAVLAAGLWLRMGFLTTLPLWIDEGFTWRDTQRDYADFISWRHHSTHPPLQYILVKASRKALHSDAEWALRTPSFIAGLLCIPAAFALGLAAHSRWLGLLLAAYVAVDPTQVHQSSQARMYTMFMLIMMAALLALSAPLRRASENAWVWIGAGLLLGLAFMASSMSLILLVAVALGAPAWAYAVQRRGDEPVLKRTVNGVAIAMVAVALLGHVGWVKILKRGAEEVSQQPAVGMALLKRLDNVMAVIGSLFGLGYAGVALIVIGLIGLAVEARRLRPLVWLMLAVGVTDVVMLGLKQVINGITGVRYFMPVGLVAWAGLVLLVFRLPAGWPRTVGVAALVGLLGWCASQNFNPSTKYWHRFGGELKVVHERMQPAEAAVILPEWFNPLANYYKVPYLSIDDARRHSTLEKITAALTAQLAEKKPVKLWVVVDAVRAEQPREGSVLAAVVEAAGKHYGVAIDGSVRPNADAYTLLLEPGKVEAAVLSGVMRERGAGKRLGD